MTFINRKVDHTTAPQFILKSYIFAMRILIQLLFYFLVFSCIVGQYRVVTFLLTKITKQQPKKGVALFVTGFLILLEFILFWVQWGWGDAMN